MAVVEIILIPYTEHTNLTEQKHFSIGSFLFRISNFFTGDKKMTSMERYNQYVKECHIKRLPDIIEHSSLAHGRLIVEHLIGFATEHKLPIYMISGSLYEEFWNPLIKPLEKYFEDEKASLKLIIINADKAKSDNNSVYNFLNDNAFSSKVVIQEGIDKKIVTSQPHFLLVGEEAYRKERSQNRAVATASFNDQVNGKRLLETFKFISNYIDNTSIAAHKPTPVSKPINSSESIETDQPAQILC